MLACFKNWPTGKPFSCAQAGVLRMSIVFLHHPDGAAFAKCGHMAYGRTKAQASCCSAANLH
ncbi:hypothetical protein CEP88_18020 [Roseobacter denitrificans]|nr:hypothetical protein CEP88_18020 [Roseobacter denitrificans]